MAVKGAATAMPKIKNSNKSTLWMLILSASNFLKERNVVTKPALPDSPPSSIPARLFSLSCCSLKLFVS